MKLAIFTIALGHDPSYVFILKAFQQYAKKVNAELIVLKKLQIKLPGKKLSLAEQAWLQKLYIGKLLKDYDRVLFLDADIIINPAAPNIFIEYKNVDYIYMFNEGEYVKRGLEIEQIRRCLNYNERWIDDDCQRYYNAGVMLCSRQSNLFNYVNIEELKMIIDAKVSMYEQTYFNYLIAKYRLPSKNLDPSYNRMSLLGENEKRVNAYFIHHAGNGYSVKSVPKHKVICSDYLKFYQKNLLFIEKIQLPYKIFHWRIYRSLHKLKNSIKKRIPHRNIK